MAHCVAECPHKRRPRKLYKKHNHLFCRHASRQGRAGTENKKYMAVVRSCIPSWTMHGNDRFYAYIVKKVTSF